MPAAGPPFRTTQEPEDREAVATYELARRVQRARAAVAVACLLPAFALGVLGALWVRQIQFDVLGRSHAMLSVGVGCCLPLGAAFWGVERLGRVVLATRILRWVDELAWQYDVPAATLAEYARLWS